MCRKSFKGHVNIQYEIRVHVFSFLGKHQMWSVNIGKKNEYLYVVIYLYVFLVGFAWKDKRNVFGNFASSAEIKMVQIKLKTSNWFDVNVACDKAGLYKAVVKQTQYQFSYWRTLNVLEISLNLYFKFIKYQWCSQNWGRKWDEKFEENKKHWLWGKIRKV